MSKDTTRKGYTKVPNRVLTMLTGEDLRAWLIIRSAAPGFAVSLHYLQSQMRLTDRTVRRIISDLTKAGMLETKVNPATRPGGHPFHTYTAVMPDEASKKKDQD